MRLSSGLVRPTVLRSAISVDICYTVCINPTRGADKSLARPTSRCILFDGENISFDASLFIQINITNIPPGPWVA